HGRWAREPPVERRPPDAGRSGDVLHGDSLWVTGSEQPLSSGEDTFAIAGSVGSQPLAWRGLVLWTPGHRHSVTTIEEYLDIASGYDEQLNRTQCPDRSQRRGSTTS